MAVSREELRELIRAEARAELWRRRLVWPLLEMLLDRDQLDDARRIFEGVDIQSGELPKDDYVLDISRQRGKSWLCVSVAAVLCHCLPRFLINYAAQELKSVRQIVEPTLAAVLEGCPRDLRPRPDAQDNLWEWDNGSRLRAFGCNNKQYVGGRGPRAHLNIKDEAGFYDEYDAVHAVLAPQLSTTKGFTIDASTPPETPSHPYTAVAMAAKARGRYSHRTIHNHPRMTPAEVESFLAKEAGRKGQTMEAFKRSSYYKREFLALHVVETTRAVVPEWSDEAPPMEGQPEGTLWGDVLTAELPRPVFAHTYSGQDFGYTRDPSAGVFAHYDWSAGRLVVEAETPALRRARADVVAEAHREVARMLWPAAGPKPYPEAEKDSSGTYWLPYMALADGSGRGLESIEELGKENLFMVPVRKAELDVRVNKLREWVARGKLYVHPRCVELRRQLATGLWADKSKTDFERTATDHLDHLAALVDLLWNLDESTCPIPVGYGFDGNHQLMVISPQRTQQRALEAVFGED